MRLISLKVLRESAKQKLSLIPFFFTFGNAFLGFLSVVMSIEGNGCAAAYCIMIAACMDVLDGRLRARLIQRVLWVWS